MQCIYGFGRDINFANHFNASVRRLADERLRYIVNVKKINDNKSLAYESAVSYDTSSLILFSLLKSTTNRYNSNQVLLKNSPFIHHLHWFPQFWSSKLDFLRWVDSSCWKFKHIRIKIDESNRGESWIVFEMWLLWWWLMRVEPNLRSLTALF